MSVEAEAEVQDMLTEMMSHYPGTSWGDEHFRAFRDALIAYPAWAVAKAIGHWVAVEPTAPKSSSIFARSVGSIVEKVDTRHGCEMCSSGSGWVDHIGQHQAVHPCPTCRKEQYDEWRSGALSGRADTDRFAYRPKSNNPEGASRLRDRLADTDWVK